MGQTIISAIGVYISTSIDYLIVLIILFAQLSQNKQKWHIYAGQYLGTSLLVGVSLVAAYVVNFVPEAWMVGLLGLIPIYLGIRFAIVGEGEEEEEEEIIERLEQSKANQLFWTVTLLTIASGGDNLSIYIPYFAWRARLLRPGVASVVRNFGPRRFNLDRLITLTFART